MHNFNFILFCICIEKINHCQFRYWRTKIYINCNLFLSFYRTISWYLMHLEVTSKLTFEYVLIFFRSNLPQTEIPRQDSPIRSITSICVQAFSASVMILLAHPLLESRDFTRTPLTLQRVSLRDEDANTPTNHFYPVQSFAHYHNGFGNDPKRSCCHNVFFNGLSAGCA